MQCKVDGCGGRKRNGATDAEALFADKKTHNGRGRKRDEYRAKARALKKASE